MSLKIGILEEADEVIYWLELLVEAGLIGKNDGVDLFAEANQLLAITFNQDRAEKRSLSSQSVFRNPKSVILRREYGS